MTAQIFNSLYKYNIFALTEGMKNPGVLLFSNKAEGGQLTASQRTDRHHQGAQCHNENTQDCTKISVE